MFQTEKYMGQLVNSLQECFGDRLVYVGLQGSYMRGEASEHSDIDPMVVIDCLSVEDLDQYRLIVERLPDPHLSCGFICGKEDLANWNPLEICHLLHTTANVYGRLEGLVPSYSKVDVLNFAKLSVNNLYHEICHRYVHRSAEMNSAGIANSYKNVFFILQNIHYLRTGEFVIKKEDLLKQLDGDDRHILQVVMDLNNGVSYEFAWLFSLLYRWCKVAMERLSTTNWYDYV